MGRRLLDWFKLLQDESPERHLEKRHLTVKKELVDKGYTILCRLTTLMKYS